MIHALKNLWNVLFHKSTFGYHSKVDSRARIGRNVTVGTWTEIEAHAKIGNNVVLGPWVKISNGAIIDNNVHLPDYVRVQPYAIVQAPSNLTGNELITPRGIIKDRCGGTISYQLNGIQYISTSNARYEIPLNIDSKQLVEDYMWGISDELAIYEV